MKLVEGTRAIEVVRGRLDESMGAQLLDFWAEHAQLSAEQARERLPQVVCVCRDGNGEIVGANSVYEEDVALIALRRFWVYRSLVAPVVDDATWERMLLICFDLLAESFEPGSPIGVFAPVADAGIRERMRDAIWPSSRFEYVGYLSDGRQARVRYFPEGRV